jgi:hypothetical protein
MVLQIRQGRAKQIAAGSSGRGRRRTFPARLPQTAGATKRTLNMIGLLCAVSAQCAGATHATGARRPHRLVAGEGVCLRRDNTPARHVVWSNAQSRDLVKRHLHRTRHFPILYIQGTRAIECLQSGLCRQFTFAATSLQANPETVPALAVVAMVSSSNHSGRKSKRSGHSRSALRTSLSRWTSMFGFKLN